MPVGRSHPRRVSSRMALNLGFRYDYFSRYTAHAPGEPDNGPHIVNLAGLTLPNFQTTGFRPFDNPYESDAFNVGPHVGFAYNPDGQSRTVIRGGFATMFQPLNGEIEKNMTPKYRPSVARRPSRSASAGTMRQPMMVPSERTIVPYDASNPARGTA